MQEVIVVLKPLWQDMKRDDPPAPLPNLKGKNSFYSQTHTFTITAWLSN